MSEKTEVQIEIPPVELIEPHLLSVDGANPNRLSYVKKVALAKSILQYGFIVPIVTNRELVVADGQQRLEVVQDFGGRTIPELGNAYFPMVEKVPVVRLPVSDVDRRLLRQVLNKIRGEHDGLADALEFQRIVEAERKEDLKLFLGLKEKDLDSCKRLLEQREKELRDATTRLTAGEDNKDFVKCPRCEYVLDPRFFRVSNPIVELNEETGIREGVDRGLGKKNNVVLNVSFATTTPEVNQRVIAIAEAFGVGVNETVTFSVYDRVEISYNDGDIIYVCGDSGSGKSTLLRLLADYEKKRGRRVVNLSEVQPSLEEVVIDGLGADVDKSMALLSLAGLSEAFLMLRKYGELSDGQKYRYKLAKLMAEAPQVAVIDEFCASLDRVMAKVISYSLNKWARKSGVMLIAASTHQDILEDLNPDILVFKGFGEDIQIRYYEPQRREISFGKDIIIEEATMRDYETLERFHYLEGGPQFRRALYKATLRDQTIGVIAYTAPMLGLSIRNRVFPQYRGGDKESAERVNKDIVRLARVIVHPKFRSVGVAVRLVRESLPLVGYPLVECIAAMPRYNPFLEKAGMVRVGDIPLNADQQRLIDTVRNLGVDPGMLHSPKECRRLLDNLGQKDRAQLIGVVVRDFASLYGQGGRGEDVGKRLVREMLEKGPETLIANLLPVKRTYLYWQNQDATLRRSRKDGTGSEKTLE